MSAASVLLSFRTMLDLKRAKGVEGKVGPRLGNDTFVAHVHGGAIDIRRGGLDEVDVTLSTDPRTLASVVHGGRPLREVEEEGGLTVEGDRALARCFVRLFRLPPKVGM